MILSTFSLTTTGSLAVVETVTNTTSPMAISIATSGGTPTYATERSLDNGTSWVITQETFTANRVVNFSGPGLFRVRYTGGTGTIAVQFLKP